MLDFYTVKRAPRYFMAGTGITYMSYGYGDNGEEFISGYHLDIDQYHVSYKDENGKWHDTQNPADWPVFDRLFNSREMWQMFCSVMGDCAQRAIEAGTD